MRNIYFFEIFSSSMFRCAQTATRSLIPSFGALTSPASCRDIARSSARMRGRGAFGSAQARRPRPGTASRRYAADHGARGRGCHLGGIPPEHLPDDLLAQTLATDTRPPVHGTEHVTVGDAGRRCPRIDRHLHPGRHRRGADPPVLSDEIDDAPAAVALLDVRERERSHFRSPQPAAQKNGQNGAIAQPAKVRDVRRVQQRSAPVAATASSRRGCQSFSRSSRGVIPAPVLAPAGRYRRPPPPACESPTFG